MIMKEQVAGGILPRRIYGLLVRTHYDGVAWDRDFLSCVAVPLVFGEGMEIRFNVTVVDPRGFDCGNQLLVDLDDSWRVLDYCWGWIRQSIQMDCLWKRAYMLKEK
jgi:hypothetical protein